MFAYDRSISALGKHCLHAFSQVVPASLAAFYRINPHLQACDFQLQGMHPRMHSAYLNHYRHIDPLKPSRCMATGLPVVPLREGLARQDEKANGEYQQFLLRHQVVDVVEVIAHLDGIPVAGLSLLRGNNLGAFSNAELQRLIPLQGLLQLAIHGCTPAASTQLDQLTPRERQIALLLRDGVSNKELARLLDLGLPTVKTHLLNLFRKVGASNRTELVSMLFL
ncbi:MAG: LuxR C-terminal-related transcriptional regulator [Pseudomonas sp.]|uniref:helix-turn-helix transcriptional regulator n=1 Tax=Pseudomonas sp. TaxID=306 RepID=UPI003981E1F4